MTDLGECLIHLELLDEQRRDASKAIEVNKQCVKVQYDKYICPWKYIEGELVLLYNQAREPLGEVNFNLMCHYPYIMQCVLEKVAYELEYYEGNVLDEPRNGLYLKRYYT
jgi:hypothetical protein